MTRALKLLGSLIAIGFLLLALWQGGREMPRIDLSSVRAWSGISIAFLLYVLGQMIGAVAWRGTLLIYGVRLIPWRAESQLLVSQILKYIPGNIAHLFGRGVLARADGVAASTIVLAMLLEVGFLLGVGAAISGLLVLTAPEFVRGLSGALPQLPVSPPVIAGGLAVCIGLVVLLIRRRARRYDPVPARMRFAVIPIGLHAVNFCVLGLSLWAVTLAIPSEPGVGPVFCTGVFVIAWCAGFVTPGAPGGIGVREGIITLGLGLVIGGGPALAAALLHRLVSVLGVVAAFGIGWLLRRGG
ncbi:lysylphosphatidylglycerol synthase domain-containing protein [Tabrizicola sp.]|uniref:lysylphosphatidylglycerol synthase domain-containing protein n=1 Tax=Tabrizicola sp. TaxID=2005166 RepID=UPI00286C2225|nr:lysylphosphatidylglycerol synthase domain-containing protein [Tabrizicola sp.]